MYQVLFVDDEPWIAEGLCNALDWQENGFLVMGCCYDSVEAAEIIIRDKPDLVMMDIRMPELSGLDCIRKCLEEGSESIFVILSGYADFEYARQSMVLSVAAYLLKPLDKEELRKAVEKASQMLVERDHIRELLRREAASNSLESGALLQEDSRYSQSVQEVVSYVNTHFQKDIRLQELARQFYINPNYLSVIFKKYTGKSFQEYLLECRMNYAASLLRTTDRPLLEIAEMSGYTDYSSFIKAFRKHYGVPPSQYRRIENRLNLM